MGTFIITAAVVIFILAGLGMWGIVADVYQEAIEDTIVEPLLRLIASNKATGVLLFIPVCSIFMSIRRAITYFPAWLFIYICMTLYGYPTDKIYHTLGFFILCAGIIKMGAVTKEYFPDAKAYKRPFKKDPMDISLDDYDFESIVRKQPQGRTRR